MRTKVPTPPDQEIYDAVMSDVDKYTGKSGHCMPRYWDYPYPQRLTVLSANLELHTLRETGDIKRYLSLQKKLTIMNGYVPPVYGIIEWLDRMMAEIKPVTPEKDIIVISLLAFGDEYILKMLNYTFASLMAFENLPCLAVEKKVVIYIQTDLDGKIAIESAPIVGQIKALGVHFDYAIIPEYLVKSLINADITYWMLGAGASLGLHYAKSLQAVFHHSFPDMVYSNRYFSELLRLSKQHRSILGSGMRSDQTLLLPALQPYFNRTGKGSTEAKTSDLNTGSQNTHNASYGLLSIPAADLIAHHMNCLHLVAWPYMVNNRKYGWTYPQHHVILWESPEHIYINSPHINALWLDYSVIKDLPARFYWTMDSEMDLICKGEDFYIPQECDDMYQAELSLPERAAITDRYADAISCSRALWTAVSHRDLVKFFLRPMKIKLNKDIRKSAKALPEKQISDEMDFLFNAIMSTDPYVGSDLPIPRTHEGRIYG